MQLKYCSRSSSLLGHLRGLISNSRLARGQGLLKNAEKGTTVHAAPIVTGRHHQGPHRRLCTPSLACSCVALQRHACSRLRQAKDSTLSVHTWKSARLRARWARCAVTNAGRSSRSKRIRGYDKFTHCQSGEEVEHLWGRCSHDTCRSPCRHWVRSG